jgi:integrase/recombinase XerC
MSPVAELDQVLSLWVSDSLMSDPAAVRLGDVARAFAERLAMAGRCSWTAATPDDCAVFVRSATRKGRRPSPATLHVRRSALRAVYRSLRATGATQVDPTIDLVLPPRSVRTARPLDDDEVALLRVVATGRTAVVVALCGAGATTTEATTVIAEHVTGGPRPVLDLPGVSRISPRSVTLDQWAAAVLDAHRPDYGQPFVVVGGSAPGSQGAQAAACNVLRRLFADCGIAGPDVRPASLRLHAAASAHRRTGRIEDAAAVLGVASLDAAADAVHWDWRNAPACDSEDEL